MGFVPPQMRPERLPEMKGALSLIPPASDLNTCAPPFDWTMLDEVMPFLTDVNAALNAVQEADAVDPEEIVRAIRVGCTDEEVAGLLGLSPAEFRRLLENDPVKMKAVSALRAQRRFNLRTRIADIIVDEGHVDEKTGVFIPPHNAQGRLLERILVNELQTHSEDDGGETTWDVIMRRAREAFNSGTKAE